MLSTFLNSSWGRGRVSLIFGVKFLVDIKMHLFGIKRTVLGPGVCLCIRI